MEKRKKKPRKKHFHNVKISSSTVVAELYRDDIPIADEFDLLPGLTQLPVVADISTWLRVGPGPQKERISNEKPNLDMS